jgi:hypothetical protein
MRIERSEHEVDVYLTHDDMREFLLRGQRAFNDYMFQRMPSEDMAAIPYPNVADLCLIDKDKQTNGEVACYIMAKPEHAPCQS